MEGKRSPTAAPPNDRRDGGCRYGVAQKPGCHRVRKLFLASGAFGGSEELTLGRLLYIEKLQNPCCRQRLERSSSLAKGLTPMTA